jgi:Fe(3+) dicitrate transport protein
MREETAYDATRSQLVLLSLLILLPLTAVPAAAVEAASPPPAVAAEARPGDDEERPDPQAIIEQRVRVVGSVHEARRSTGSEQFIDREQLERHQHSDVHRILTRVPGVYLQDEEGYGLRPNIGLRGTGVERSQKVTLMEDGVPISPAPYSAPSAYYFPTAGRMESVEVSKGPASIRQGPNTTGGVLNLISRGIPTRFTGVGELAVGDDGLVRGKAAVGDSSERLGWSFETYQQSTDGFKQLDGGGDTGFDLEDYVGKFRLNSREGTRVYQSLELKLGATDQDGEETYETYLGLTQEDFNVDPYRRYVASSRDRIVTEHEQIQLRHFIVPADGVDITTTVYYNEFFRNWRKLQSVAGAGIGDILADPFDADNAARMAIIRGEADSAPGDLRLRNNRREYYSAGLQSQLGLRFGSGRVRHEIEVGIRLHEDEEDRYQEEDEFQMLAGELVLTQLGAPASQSNRISSARALALFVQDSMTAGRWKVRPGVRFETVEFTREDFGKADPDRTGVDLVVRKNDVDAVVPGVGVTFDANERVNLFGGIHKGFAPPGPGRDAETDPEESINYELGARRVSRTGSLQAVAFFNDYDNLLGTDTASSGGTGTGDQFNGGAVRVRGLELALNRIIELGERGFSIPLQLAYTYTEGEFRSQFETSFADWAPEVFVGDELPYLPRHVLFGEIGWRTARWGAFGSASWVDEMRTTAGQGAIPEAERIEDHLVFDVAGELRFRRHYRAFVQVRNLTDEVYVAARRPAGLRPGLPRTAVVGIGASF